MWTKTPPERTGLYWVRAVYHNGDRWDYKIVEVVVGNGIFYAWSHGSDIESFINDFNTHEWWNEPLEPPQ